VAEALNPHGLVLPSPSNIWEVIENLQMLWIGIGICHHAVTNTFVDPDLTSCQKAWITVRHRMRMLCSGWGSKPTWIGSPIPSKPIRSDWQPSYAKAGDMDPSSLCYQLICWPRFGKWAKCPCQYGTSNETVLQWWRLFTHMDWFLYPLKTYEKWLKTSICCGWGYESVIMLLPTHLLAQIW